MVQLCVVERWPKRTGWLGTAVGAALSCAVAAFAGEPVRLEEVTVEASPVDRYLPARAEVGRDEIIDSHKDEISDVLDLTPGVNARQGGRGEARIDVRGFDQRAVLFTLNGIPVYEPYNGVIDVNLFPLEMLAGMEIIRGASSSLYGPNGMAGQIKLSTFEPRAPLTAAVSTTWRDPELWDARASGGLKRGAVSSFLAGRYIDTPNFSLANDFNDRPPTQRRYGDGGKRLNSDRDQKSGFGSLGYEYADNGRAHVAVLASDATFGVPPSTTQFVPMFRRTDKQTLFHSQAGVEQRVLPIASAVGGVFFTACDSDESQFDGPDFNTLLVATGTESREVGGIARVTIDAFESDTFAIAGQIRSDSARIKNSVRGHLADPNFLIGSVGAENVYFATDRISLVLGVSYDVLDRRRPWDRRSREPAGYRVDRSRPLGRHARRRQSQDPLSHAARAVRSCAGQRRARSRKHTHVRNRARGGVERDRRITQRVLE